MKEGTGEKLIYNKRLNVEKFYSLYRLDELKEIFIGNGYEIINTMIEEKFDKWINIYGRKK